MLDARCPIGIWKSPGISAASFVRGELDSPDNAWFHPLHLVVAGQIDPVQWNEEVQLETRRRKDWNHDVLGLS